MPLVGNARLGAAREEQMLSELTERQSELLDAVDHACLQIIHINRGVQWKHKKSARMPKAQDFDFQALLKKTSEG